MGFADAVGDFADLVDDQLEDSESGDQATQNTRLWVRFYSDDQWDGVVDHTPSPVDATVAERTVASVIDNVVTKVGSRTPLFRIVGFNSGKSFGASGNWTLNIKAGGPGVDDLMALISDPEDTWVRIAVIRNGVTVDTMFGPMNSITETMQRGADGTRVVSYALTGQDHHKVLDHTQLFVNVYENEGQMPMVTLYDAMKDSLSGSPSDIVRALIDAWLGNNGVADKQWQLPKSLGGGFFYDLLGLDFGVTEGYINDPALYNPDQYQGRTLWSALQANCNPMLNELFTKLKNDVPFDPDKPPIPQLVMRERPFPTESYRLNWDTLQSWKIGPADVQSRNMTKGAPESRYNYWLIDGEGIMGSGFGAMKEIQDASGASKGQPGGTPIYSLRDMRKHGFRRYMQSTKYVPWRDDQGWFLVSAGWIKMLHDWYSVAPYELSGSITTNKLFPRIQIGDRIREERSNGRAVIYYVEGVSHSWSYPGPGTSTFQLTRGEYEHEDLFRLVYRNYLGQSEGLQFESTELTLAAQGLAGVPTGSGARLDKGVGQPEPVERVYLRSRGLLDDQEQIDAGEGVRDNERRRVRAGDLPNLNIKEDYRELTEGIPPREDAQGGNLTQRELEQGIPLRREGTAADQGATEDATEDINERARIRQRVGRTRRRGTF